MSQSLEIQISKLNYLCHQLSQLPNTPNKLTQTLLKEFGINDQEGVNQISERLAVLVEQSREQWDRIRQVN